MLSRNFLLLPLYCCHINVKYCGNTSTPVCFVCFAQCSNENVVLYAWGGQCHSLEKLYFLEEVYINNVSHDIKVFLGGRIVIDENDAVR